MRKAPPHSLWHSVPQEHSRQAFIPLKRRAKLQVAEKTGMHRTERYYLEDLPEAKTSRQATGCQGLEQRKGLPPTT